MGQKPLSTHTNILDIVHCFNTCFHICFALPQLKGITIWSNFKSLRYEFILAEFNKPEFRVSVYHKREIKYIKLIKLES